MISLEVLFVVALIAFALGDLVVGVVNDAVNFTQSSIGSRVASRRVILLVAGIGVVIGALFSDGIIEVTRKGIFHPGFFNVSEVMMIFLAVAASDILLLDFYSTYGLPTSTTVSVIFEILGAALTMALWKSGWDFGSAWIAVNAGSVANILLGILLSIAFALIAGLLFQFLSRLFFTFHFDRMMSRRGFVWCGAVLTSLVFFILLKGSSHAFFMTEELKIFIKQETWYLLALFFVLFSVISFLLIRLRVPIMRGIILLGTASLGMAFAGNDLANFVGVSVSGVQAFLGADLQGVLQTPWWVLSVAGLVMMATMYFSRKIHTVTKTELSLASHHKKVHLRWKPNAFAEVIVGMVRTWFAFVVSIIPLRLMDWFRTRWDGGVGIHDHHDYDVIRAGVNLFVSASLISIATSKKLPLSTTFVAFIVAMGSSLADGAWTADTAAQRLTGVITVIGCWFLTAIFALVIGGVVLSLLHLGGYIGFFALIVIVVAVVYKLVKVHHKREGMVTMFDDVLE